jgi:hypothetical protein
MTNIQRLVRGLGYTVTALVCLPLARAQAPSTDALKQELIRVCNS